MDVNLNAEAKGYGVPAASVVKQEDRTKPQVTPVEKNSKSEAGALNDQALHGKSSSGQQKSDSPKLSKAELQQAVEGAQKRLDAIGGNLSLGLYEEPKGGEIVVQIKDTHSDKVIRQIPSQDILELRAKLDDLVGLLMDKNA